MDRLSTLIIVVAVAGCESKPSSEAAPTRANVAKTAPTNAASVEAFCDVHFPPGKGPAFQLPPLVDGALPATTASWRWINVWATWCKPCVEEMPRLVSWRDRLAATGKPFELAFISVDEDAAALAAHRTAHPETPPSPRLADPAKQAAWYAAVGLDASAPIPIHIFVDASGLVRCARAGGVRERDFAAIERLLRE